MRPIIRLYAALALMLCIGKPLSGAPAADFYTTLLNRGVVSFDAGRHQEAVQQLRIAAFGFVDSPDLYQAAQTYLTVAHHRLGDSESAREAARKIVAVQRIGPRFAAVELPAALRSAFETAAASLLNPAELTTLRNGAAGQPAPTTAQATTTRPRSPALKPQTAAQPAGVGATPSSPDKSPASTPLPQQQPATTTPPRTSEITIPFPAQQPATGTAKPQGQNSTPPASTSTTSSDASPAAGAPATPPRPAASNSPASTSQPVPQTRAPATPAPASGPAVSRPTTPATTTSPRPATPAALSATEVTSRLANAERALGAALLADARAIYRDLLSRPGIERGSLLKLAEGLYRSRDFTNALEAFRRLGTLTRSEEPYRYYVAVALYETGDYVRAKQELTAVLPFIEVTPDVARYRAKIDGSVQ